ncbi:MAG: selenide, water dikinase SelD, partial [Comamonadaceae bacterium]|nr:selenide, water dikinase SelD [Comamonadaceae bacterium]
LLAACAPECCAEVLDTLRRHGCAAAACIGEAAEGAPRLVVR